MRIVITGGNGYIGKHLIDKLLQLSYEVTELTRSAPYNSSNEWKKYDFNSANIPAISSDTKALIHLATTNFLSLGTTSYENEFNSTKKLIKICQKRKIKFIFISSHSQDRMSATKYGRIKYALEKSVLLEEGIVLRTGLVYGGRPEGLFGSLIKFIRKSPFLPILIPSPIIQPIHVDELTDVIIKCITKKTKSKVYLLGSINAINFNDFIFSFKKFKSEKFHIPIYIPGIIFFTLKKILSAKYAQKLFVDRFISLYSLKKMNTNKDLKYFDLRLMNVEDGLQEKRYREKHLIAKEGFILLTYLLKKKPPHSLVRKYINYISSTNALSVIQFNQLTLKCPKLIALLDDNSSHNTLLNRKLNVASLIAEASTTGAKRYLFSNSTKLQSINLIFNVLMFELFLRVIRLINLINRKFLIRLLTYADSI